MLQSDGPYLMTVLETKTKDARGDIDGRVRLKVETLTYTGAG
jgi:hypothetical protein